MGIEQIRALKAGAKFPKKKFYKIPKVSSKKIALNEAEKENKNEQDIWFAERRKEMTGKCVYCGSKTEKNNNATFKNSIAHIFAKRKNMFPSIAKHPLNFLELCYYENSCHANFDNNFLSFDELINSRAKAELKNKINTLYAAMTNQEKSRIPDNVLKFMNKESN